MKALKWFSLVFFVCMIVISLWKLNIMETRNMGVSNVFFDSTIGIPFTLEFFGLASFFAWFCAISIWFCWILTFNQFVCWVKWKT